MEHFEYGRKVFLSQEVVFKSWSRVVLKSCICLLKFVLYLYCSKNLLSMVVNRAKSKSFIAEDITQRLPQLTGQSTATVDWAVDWWWSCSRIGFDSLVINCHSWLVFSCLSESFVLYLICWVSISFYQFWKSWTISNTCSSSELSWLFLIELVYLRSWSSNFLSWSILNWFSSGLVLQVSWPKHFLLCVLELLFLNKPFSDFEYEVIFVFWLLWLCFSVSAWSYLTCKYFIFVLLILIVLCQTLLVCFVLFTCTCLFSCTQHSEFHQW